VKTSIVAGQPSWEFSSDRVEVAITEQGGQMAPVRFRVGKRTIEPFSIAPWAEEKCPKGTPPILKALRGDFFCAPFGGNEVPYKTEKHPPHGESANARWRFKSLQQVSSGIALNLSLRTKIRPGKIEKSIQLRHGHTAIYCQHVLSGMSGPMNLGHHAMLRFPDYPGSGHISTSPIEFGQVAPRALEDPAQGGYSSLSSGASFSHLDCVPSRFGGSVDVSRYPARRGFEDLLMVVHAGRGKLAWTAVTFPNERYVWFSLKDPSVLQSTIFWISNGGRHYAPWNGRHINVMGLEDVTSYFHYGLKESAGKNPLIRRGFHTHIKLDTKKDLIINYIMGVAAIPPDFQEVKSIQTTRGGITLTSPSGRTAHARINLDFLNSIPNET